MPIQITDGSLIFPMPKGSNSLTMSIIYENFYSDCLWYFVISFDLISFISFFIFYLLFILLETKVNSKNMLYKSFLILKTVSDLHITEI